MVLSKKIKDVLPAINDSSTVYFNADIPHGYATAYKGGWFCDSAGFERIARDFPDLEVMGFRVSFPKKEADDRI
jgi:hypothetical protein